MTGVFACDTAITRQRSIADRSRGFRSDGVRERFHRVRRAGHSRSRLLSRLANVSSDSMRGGRAKETTWCLKLCSAKGGTILEAVGDFCRYTFECTVLLEACLTVRR